MIGGTLKIIGLMLVVVGVLALLAGLGAAGYGFVNEDENQERFIADPDQSEQNEALMTYGLIGAGAGLVILVVGIILAVAGGSVSRHAVVAAQAPTRTTTRGAWIGGLVALVILVAVVVTIWAVVWGGNESGFASTFGGDSTNSQLLEETSFNGTVRNAYSTPLESGTTDSADSTRMFEAPDDTRRIQVNVTWSPQMGGADNLRISLEFQEGEAWRELGRAGGESPLVITRQTSELDGAILRYQVFANSDVSVVMEQEFEVNLKFYGVSDS